MSKVLQHFSRPTRFHTPFPFTSQEANFSFHIVHTGMYKYPTNHCAAC